MQNKETKKTALVRSQKSPLIYIVASFVIVALMIGGFVALKQRIERVDYRQVIVGGKAFKLELANTEASRAEGLSQRDSIPADGGMLFDFGSDGDWRMWMLQMRFPIDIAWLAKDGKIVGIKHSAQPGDYPEVYHASQPSRYAIEVKAGTLQSLSIKEGDIVHIR